MTNVKNLLAVGVTLFILASCGSSNEDIDAVAANMMTGTNPLSEKDAKCFAKSLKKNMNDDQWNKMVAEANGEEEQMDLENLEKAMEEAFALLAPMGAASVECGVPLDG